MGQKQEKDSSLMFATYLRYSTPDTTHWYMQLSYVILKQYLVGSIIHILQVWKLNLRENPDLLSLINSKVGVFESKSDSKKF